MAAPISTTYTQEERDEIAARVMREVSAGRSVTGILMHDDGMPDRSTFWDWVRKDEALAAELARAREHGIEARLEDAQAIADGDDVVSLDGLSGDALARAMWRNNPKMQRLRYDARIKMAQMLKPKKYGPKLDLTTDGKALNEPPADDAEKAAALLKRVEQRLDPKTQDLLS